MHDFTRWDLNKRLPESTLEQCVRVATRAISGVASRIPGLLPIRMGEVVLNVHVRVWWITIVFFSVIVSLGVSFTGGPRGRSMSLTRQRMCDGTLTERDAWLEELFDFAVDGLPEMLIPLSWDGKVGGLMHPVFRKKPTLLRRHREDPDGTTFVRQDLVDSFFNRPHSILPVTSGDISVLYDRTNEQVLVSYPDSLDSILGALELDPITFIAQESTQDGVMEHGEVGLFPTSSYTRATTSSAKHGSNDGNDTIKSPRQVERLPSPPPPVWYRGRTSGLSRGAQRKRTSEPTPLTTPPRFKPGTLKKLAKRIKKR